MPAWALRLLPWALGAIAALGVLHVVNGWREKAERLQVVEKEYAVYRTGVETAARVRQEVSDGYQSELETLRAAAGQRAAPAVRLCTPSPVVPGGGSAGGRDGAGAASGQLPGGAGPGAAEGPGPDIGAELYAVADRADRLAAQLRACQAFVDKVRTKPGD